MSRHWGTATSSNNAEMRVWMSYKNLKEQWLHFWVCKFYCPLLGIHPLAKNKYNRILTHHCLCLYSNKSKWYTYIYHQLHCHIYFFAAKIITIQHLIFYFHLLLILKSSAMHISIRIRTIHMKHQNHIIAKYFFFFFLLLSIDI